MVLERLRLRRDHRKHEAWIKCRRHDADGRRSQHLSRLQEDGIMEYEILETRDDGTFVIMKDGNPYHVTPEYCPELYAAVCAQEGIEVPEQTT